MGAASKRERIAPSTLKYPPFVYKIRNPVSTGFLMMLPSRVFTLGCNDFIECDTQSLQSLRVHHIGKDHIALLIE
jgi:hypothetical protein